MFSSATPESIDDPAPAPPSAVSATVTRSASSRTFNASAYRKTPSHPSVRPQPSLATLRSAGSFNRPPSSPGSALGNSATLTAHSTASTSSSHMPSYYAGYGTDAWARPGAIHGSATEDDEDEASGRGGSHMGGNAGGVGEARWSGVVFFRRHSRQSTAMLTESDADEITSLLGIANPVKPWRGMLVGWTGHMWSRNLLFIIIPVLLVLLWATIIPFPYTVPPEDLLGQVTHRPRDGEPEPMILDFWFFLLFYYGTYNAVALTFITHVFKLYSLDWWPRSLNGLVSNAFFWVLSILAGMVLRFHTPWYEYTLAWVLLTFLTMSCPLLVAFAKIQRESRNVFRHSLTLAQRTFVDGAMLGGGKIPASYRRFLWFTLVLLLAQGTLCAGGWYAYYFVSTLPHSGAEGILYVYSWVAVVYSLDFLVETVAEEKIRSYPLCGVLRLYFYMLYFIFYRNLFARLRNISQFALIQIASSVWVSIFYPLRMTRPVHAFLSRHFGVTSDYDAYIRTIGQSFFTRNLAENSTMLGFLAWVSLLHFGHNAPVYPYFGFDVPGDPYTYRLTMLASLGVWASELLSGYVTRRIFKHYFSHSITREAVKDMRRFPEMVPCMFLVILHVLMDMLLALLKLHFV